MKNKKRIIIAIAAFWMIFACILLAHILTGTATFRVDYSISRFVGLTMVSSIVFLIGNIFVSASIGQYVEKNIYELIEKKKSPKTFLESIKSFKTLSTSAKLYTILISIIVAALIGVSLCPYGLFDNPETSDAPVTMLHMLFARLMFVVMFIVSIVNVIFSTKKKYFKKRTRNFSIGFLILGTICSAFYIFAPDIFWGLDIVFEATYIAAFMFMLLTF